jgi:hypothetical protein
MVVLKASLRKMFIIVLSITNFDGKNGGAKGASGPPTCMHLMI